MSSCSGATCKSTPVRFSQVGKQAQEKARRPTGTQGLPCWMNQPTVPSRQLDISVDSQAEPENDGFTGCLFLASPPLNQQVPFSSPG